MDELAASYEEWRSRPFPHGSEDDELDEIHADLVLADTWVADIVIPFMDQGSTRLPAWVVSGELRKIRERAVILRESADEEGGAVADSYLAYADALIDVYDRFLEVIRPGV